MTALYARVSTQEQAAHGYSVEEQQERLKQYAAAMGWEPFSVFVDPGYSGASMNRPALRRLLDEIHAGTVERVVVYKLDRLSRSQKDTMLLIEDEFLAHKVEFVSMSENFDTSTPFGRASLGVLSVFAQLEREQIRERLQMGMDARLKKGLFKGSCRVPTGYDYTDGQLVPNEESAVIPRIYSLAAAGLCPGDICKELTALVGGQWLQNTVRRIIRNPAYKGYIRAKDGEVQGQHAPLVSVELWGEANAKLDAASDAWKNSNRRDGHATHALAGLVYCAECGEKLYRQKTKYKRKDGSVHEWDYYRSKVCPHANASLRLDEIEAEVFSQLRQIKVEEKRVEQKPVDPAPLVKKIDDQIARLLDLYAMDRMPKDQIEAKLHELEDRRALLLQPKKETRPALKPDEFKRMAAVLDSLGDDLPAVRRITTSLIRRVEVKPGLTTIFWNL